MRASSSVALLHDKETGTSHWVSLNTGGTNSSGFTTLPGGLRDIDGTFNLAGDFACFWSATELDASSAWYRFLYYDFADVLRSLYYKLVKT